MAINFVNRGLLSFFFIIGLTKTVAIPSRPKFRTGIALLAIWGLGAIVLAAFPTNFPGGPVTTHGEIHLVVALIAFICGAFGILFLSLHFKEEGQLRALRKYVFPIAIISPILMFVTIFGLESKVGGLLERIFLGSVLLWMLIVSMYLFKMRLSSSTPETTLKDPTSSVA